MSLPLFNLSIYKTPINPMNKTKKPNTPFTPKIIHFGIDYIRLIFSRYFVIKELNDFFIGLSANSNYREIDWYGYHFVLDYTFSGSKRTLKFTYENFPILYLCSYENTGVIGQNISHSIDIYSTAFYIPELQRFFSQFWKNIGFRGKITRLDLACDLICTPKEILDCGYITQFPKGAMLGYNEKNGSCETRYFGEKQSKNKRHLIRIYDKLKDSQKKQKLKLFGAYFQFPNVTRVEVEIRSTTAKSLQITPQKIGDLDFLESVFRTLVINESGTYFNALSNLDLSQAQKIELDRSSVEIPLSRLDISKRFLGMAVNLHESGADPIGFLIEKFSRLGVYRNSIDWQRLQKSVHNIEKLKFSNQYKE